MIGAVLRSRRNSCISSPAESGQHYSRRMSQPTPSTQSQPNAATVRIKRCSSSSKAEHGTSIPVNTKERLNSELQSVAQNLCMIESAIPCMQNDEESQELMKNLRDTNRKLQQILPVLHVFMTLPPPVAKDEKERFQFERKKMGRDFESALISYKHSHKALHAAMKHLKGHGPS